MGVKDGTMTRVEFRKLLSLKMPQEAIQKVMEAYRLSKYGHRNQARDNGGRYFEHPRRVALILMQELDIWDHEMIVAALLHDVVEDSYIFGEGSEAFSNIEARFGKRVARYVRNLTKEKCDPEEKVMRDRQYFERIRRADRRTKILKCADRLDNLRDLHQCTVEKKRHYVEETTAYFFSMAQTAAPQLYQEMAAICEATRQSLEEKDHA